MGHCGRHEMSEHIEIESEATANSNLVIVRTNLALADGDAEHYDSTAAMEEGSPVAQALATIEGIVALHIETNDLIVKHDLDTPWHLIEAEISAALKEFFL